MKKNARRLIALLLTFSMALSMLSATAWATAVEMTEPDVGAALSEENEPAAEEDTPAEEPVAETPEEEAPVEDVPVEDTPAEADPAEETDPDAGIAPQAEETNAPDTAAANGRAITGYSRDEIKSIIQDVILGGGNTVVDLSPYGITGREMNTLSAETLEENNMTNFAEVNYNTAADGTVTTMSADVDPAMAAAFAEVDEVAEDSGETVHTAEDIKQLYAAYQQFKVENVDYFGVNVPYDTEKDIASPLGAMLDMASLDANTMAYIEAGYVSADDIEGVYGMVQLFYIGAQLAVNMYGDQLLAAKNDALSQLTDDMSDTEKLLVLNDWLANWSSFAMEYIMRDEDNNPIMIAPEEDSGSYENQIIQATTQMLIQQGLDSETASAQAAVLGPSIYGMLEGNQFGPLVVQRATCAGYTYAYDYLVQWAFPEIYKDSQGNWKTWQELNYNEKTTSEIVTVQGNVPQYDEETGKVAVDPETGEILYAVDEEGNPVVGNVPKTEEREDDPATEDVDEGGIYVVTDDNGIVYKTEEKESTELEWSPDADYIVDNVKITYAAEISMFGEVNENFSSVHYWNAVKVDGEWYYVDTTYNDVYVEVMARDRVETDGNLTHLYFLVSDTSIRNMYDGNYSAFDTLYEGVATDRTYEDAWFAFAKSPIYLYNGDWYYFYDSTDTIDMMEQFGNFGMSGQADTDFGGYDIQETEYKLVVHKDGLSDSDTSFTTLVDFNNAQVLNPSTGTLEDNELIAELYAKYQEYAEIYPSIAISGAFYNNVFYFSIANCVLSYDLKTGEVVKVKEYNKVNAQRDLTKEMGGEAFSLVGDDVELDPTYDFTISNPPVASIVIRENGEMTVSLATNFAFISGKEDAYDTTSSYGYEFEETNYNPNYSSYMANIDLTQWGYENEINDNDEFMWSANVVDIISMSHLTGSSHTYETVTVDPFCGEDGFTEERCTECGLIKDGTRVYEEGTALDHHFVKFDETYYTKDSNGNWNTGTAYVCTICKYAIDEDDDDWDPAIAENAGHVYTAAEGAVEWSEDNTTATITELVCDTCEDAKLDCLVDDDTVTITGIEVVCTAGEPEISGECDTGLITTYTATGEYNGAKVVVTKTEQGEAGEHAYEGTFTWADDYSSASAVLTCAVCGDTETVDCVITKETTPATCEEDGKTVYTATATAENGQTVTDTKEESIPALGHDYGEPVWSDWTDDNTCTATFVCAHDATHTQTVEAVVTEDTGDATCTEAGTITYSASVEFEGETYTNPEPKTVTGQALGHDYEVTWTWNDDFSSATATFTCVRGDDVQTAEAVVTSEITAEPDCTTTGETLYTAVAVDPDGEEVTDTQSVIIPALGHVDEDGDGICDRCGEVLTVETPVLTSVTNSATGVTVQWDAVENAAAYRVFRRVAGETWTRVADNTTETSFVDTTVESGTTYIYTVRCITSDGNAYTSDYDRTGKSVLYIAAPTISSLVNATSGIVVNWGAEKGAVNYRVYRRVSGGSWTKVGDTTGTSFTDTTAVAGTVYAYTVRCINANATTWTSGYNAIGKGVIRLENPVITLTNATSGVNVKWNAVAGAKGYYVCRKASGGSYSVIANITNGSTVNYVDTTAVNGTVYAYAVRAYYGGYMSSFTARGTIRLSSPTISSVSNSASGAMTVKWSKNASATGYQVYYKVGSTAKLAAVKGTSTLSTTISGLTKGSTYTVYVRSFRTIGGVNYYSSWSASKNVTISK